MRKVTYLLGVIFTFLSITSCSNDSEPASDPAKDKELAEWIKSRVLDDKGEIVFVKNDAADGLYAIPAGSEKEGVYNTIEFRIRGVPAINLDITSWEYLNNDKSYGEIGSKMCTPSLPSDRQDS